MKFNTFLRTIKVVKNPLVLLSLRRGKAPCVVEFRNGLVFRLTWPQFRSLRDSYQYFEGCSITQAGNDLFKLSHEKSEIKCASHLVPLFCELMSDFSIKQEKDQYQIKNNSLQLTGFIEMLACIQELKAGEYDCDYREKVVLDVGGFQGETAIYFLSKGAKRVVIYEPIRQNAESIRRNLALNNMDAEIYQVGIGDKDDVLTIDGLGYGIHYQPEAKTEIRVMAASKIIEQSRADIAKIDCEGAESCLVNVAPETLRLTPYYMLEVHSPQIRADIIHKFQHSGFTLKKEIKKSPPCKYSTIHFEINDRPRR